VGGLQPLSQLGFQWWYVDPSGVVTIIAPSATETYPDKLGWAKTMTDVVTTGWRKISSSGGIVNNPLTSTRTEVMLYQDQGVKVSTSPGNGYTYYGECPINWVHAALPLPGAGDWDSDLVDNLKLEAVTKAAANVKSPSVYGAVFLGELRETIAMLKHPIGGLQDFIKDRRKWELYKSKQRLKGSKVRQARDRTFKESIQDGSSAAANSWLEARLGWRPFLMELEALRKELEEGTFN